MRQGCWRDLQKNVHCSARLWVAHRRQIVQSLDRLIAQPLIESVVFLLNLCLRRVRRPSDADMAEIFETDLDGAVDLPKSNEKLSTQPGDDSQIHEAKGALSQRRKT